MTFKEFVPQHDIVDPDQKDTSIIVESQKSFKRVITEAVHKNTIEFTPAQVLLIINHLFHREWLGRSDKIRRAAWSYIGRWTTRDRQNRCGGADNFEHLPQLAGTEDPDCHAL